LYRLRYAAADDAQPKVCAIASVRIEFIRRRLENVPNARQIAPMKDSVDA
jgi:hypothetical protein